MIDGRRGRSVDLPAGVAERISGGVGFAGGHGRVALHTGADRRVMHDMVPADVDGAGGIDPGPGQGREGVALGR